ncbi:hypothetical protein ACLOJK_025495 [Asimina triloba]
MAEGSKQPTYGTNLVRDVKALVSALRARRTTLFLTYAFMFAFVACTVFLAFNPTSTSSPWLTRIFSSQNPDASNKSQFNSLLSRFFPDSSRPSSPTPFSSDAIPAPNQTPPGSDSVISAGNQTHPGPDAAGNRTQVKSENESLKGALAQNQTQLKPLSPSSKEHPSRNQTQPKPDASSSKEIAAARNQTQRTPGSSSKEILAQNQTQQKPESSGSNKSPSELATSLKKRNGTAASSAPTTTAKASGKQGSGNVGASAAKGRGWEELVDGLKHCNVFDGRWVEDDSYPLYPAGSCPHIDESFNCVLNGRPDHTYQKLRWKPNGCEIPRLNATDMLERLRGKRLVFVGDSLNRNMWESLVCILSYSVQDKNKVFEASGRKEFRTEGSYSFIFKDYNCSVEFFRSPFLVQEWETTESNGTRKETLRLDLIERSSDKFKNADVIVFNTGHWWTHEKTSKGKDYYQEGSHVYGTLNVVEAFRKALTTWARWVDANVNPKKSLVFFRGYSASHFRGGQWNSGGACDSETEPIKNDTYLAPYPPKMHVLERVIRGTKTTPINYLNITRLTDYRKDAHPSIYRKQNLTEEERRAPERYQDCSHWCLPGVPDVWNELLYAQLLIKLGKH